MMQNYAAVIGQDLLSCSSCPIRRQVCKYLPFLVPEKHWRGAEVMVAINGPEPTNCDSVVSEGLVEYWKNSKLDHHFIRLSRKIRPYFVSKSIDKLRSVVPRNPFMIFVSFSTNFVLKLPTLATC